MPSLRPLALAALSWSAIASAEEPASGEPHLGGGGVGGAGGSGSGTGSGSLSMTPDGSLPGVTTDPAKKTVTLRVDATEPVAYRGDRLAVRGTIALGGRGVVGHPVSVFLAQQGMAGEGAVLVGSGLSAPDGTFLIDAELPSSLDLAAYELFAVCNEDARYNAATSP